jgi:hypothetical protein
MSCMCVCGHTGVQLVLILVTKYKQALRHSGCAERSLKTGPTGEDFVYGVG